MKNGLFYPIPDKYKYSLAFNTKVNAIVSEEKDKYLSMASKENFKKYLPSNIDLDKKIDFLGFAGEAFIANRLNLNDDGVSSAEAVKIAELLPMSFVDLNHSRKDIVGVILSASFAEFGTGKEMTKEEALASKSPFSVIIGGIVWKLANPELAEMMEESNNESSENKDSLFISWELAFSDYNLILINAQKKNFEDGQFVTNNEEINNLDKNLRAYGGNGIYNGLKVGRVPVGDVIPLGVGIVEDPAAKVKPIVSTANLLDNDKNIENSEKKQEKIDLKVTIQNTNNIDEADVIIKVYDEKSINIEKNISQLDNNNVNANRNLNKTMKVKNIADITDESLKECSASEIKEIFASDFEAKLNAEVKKISDDYFSKLSEKENKVKDVESTLAEVKRNYDSVKAELDKLVKLNQDKEKIELFSARMNTIENTFDLTEDQKNSIGEDVKNLVDEESFAKFMKKQELFLKKKGSCAKCGKSKASCECEEEMDESESKKKTAKASVENFDQQKALEDAIKNGEKKEEVIPNTQSKEKSMTELSQEVFGLGGWDFTKRR